MYDCYSRGNDSDEKMHLKFILPDKWITVSVSTVLQS
jgi:hypothetical protein